MCLQPKYVPHPTLKRITRYCGFDMVSLDGTVIPFTDPRAYSDYFEKHLLYRELMTPDYIRDHFYVFNSETGETHPLFFAAPCLKCDECLTSKYSELSARLQFEVLSYPKECRVIFFTLTYADKYLPSDGVSRGHITDFINLLHIYSTRSGLPSGFRTFIVSEYGTDPRFTHRPHYHGLIFGLDLSTYGHIKLFNKVIAKAWRKRGRIDWQFARSAHGVSKYCTKYVIKGLNKDFVPEGKNANFISYPIKSGGLGVNALKNPVILDKILNSTDGSISVSTLEFGECGATSGVSKIRIPRFIIDKLFPPFSRFITSNIKRCLKWMSHAWNALMRRFDPVGLKSPCEVEKKFSYLRGFVDNSSPPLIDLPLHTLCSRFSEKPLPQDVPQNIDCTKNVEKYRILENYYCRLSTKALKRIYNTLVDYLENFKYDCQYALDALKRRSQYLMRFDEVRPPRDPRDGYAYKHSFIQKCYVDSPLDSVLCQ